MSAHLQGEMLWAVWGGGKHTFQAWHSKFLQSGYGTQGQKRAGPNSSSVSWVPLGKCYCPGHQNTWHFAAHKINLGLDFVAQGQALTEFVLCTDVHVSTAGRGKFGSLVGLFFRREHKTFGKTCESWISLRSLHVYQVWLRLASWLRCCWRTRGGGHSADCISLIFSLASYGKKSWVAMTSFLTAHRTFLFRGIFSQIWPTCFPIQYLKLHIWHKPVLTDDHENIPFYFRGKKMEIWNSGLLPVCLQPAERFPL